MTQERTYHIYLIEKDMIYRSMLRQYLESKSAASPNYKWRLFTFETMDQFLNALSSHPSPDFIFTDVIFDETHAQYKEGLAAIEKVKEVKFNCPIYFITDKKKEHIQNLQESGVEGVLSNELEHIEEVVKTLKKELNLKA